jgi:hypothetical protein
MSGFAQYTQPEKEGSRWRPVMIAGAIVVVLVIVIWALSRGRSTAPAGPAAPPAYASKLQISDVHMSTAKNFLNVEVTYVEGKVTNTGDQTVIGAQMETIFRNMLGEVVDRQTQPVSVAAKPLGEPDWVPLSTSPLTPGKVVEFRLTFEHISADWNMGYPELRVVSVKTK